MDREQRNKLYNRITYFLFTCLLIATIIFPMFSIKTITGAYSEESCSSVSAYQLIKIGLMSEEGRSSEASMLAEEIAEFGLKLEKEGKSDEDILKALKTNSAYNEFMLINVCKVDDSEVKSMAICLLITYIVLGVLALMFIASMIVRKDIFDMVNIFAAAAASVVAIVALIISFTLTIEIIPNAQSFVICSEMIMYVLAIGPVALTVVEAVQFFLARKKRKLLEKEIIKPFTGEAEE